MAKPRTRQSFYYNPSLAGEDELANGAPTDGSSTSVLILAVFYASTPALAPALALPEDIYINADF